LIPAECCCLLKDAAVYRSFKCFVCNKAVELE
jgi:hypothetical protein